MASRHPGELAKQAQAGDILLVVHEFAARSPDELSLAKGDRIELIERDDDFGDGWYLGRHMQNGNTGLFPEVYTTAAPKTAPAASKVNQTQNMLSPTAADVTKTEGNAEAGEKTPSATDTNTSSYFTPATSSTAAAPPAPTTTAPPAESATTPTVRAPDTPTATTAGSAPIGQHSPQQSAVMNETLSVINEHITSMNKPSPGLPALSPAPEARERRPSMTSHDSGSQYSANASQTRLPYVAGEETDEEEGGALTEAEVTKWSPTKVAEYLESVGVEKSHCDLFREEEFTGEVILQMEQSQVFMKEFNLGPIGRRMRTWQKIKNLQDEVRLAKSQGFGKMGQRRAFSPSMGSTPPITGQSNPRPSAASVRSISHRRHSSTEQNPPSGYRSPRIQQSSFDRGWTMGGASMGTDSLSPPPTMQSNGSQPMSPSHLHTASADGGRFGKNSRGSSRVSLPMQNETEVGYTSAGDGENKKTKNVLRKNPLSADFGQEKRKSGNYFWQRTRAESEVKAADEVPQTMVTQYDGGVRVVSEPITGNQTSPTVTRLEYDNDMPRNRDSASKTSSTDPKRASTTSEATQGSAARRGFRTISDAITGREKSLITTSDRTTQYDESITESPDRTSSYLSGGTPTMDNEEATRSQGAPGLATSGTRRKTKKETSAYTRGLEKKAPQEQMRGCDHSGWMKKKSSNLITTWKPRLFVLRGRRLSYYYSETDMEEKGLIDISNHRVLPAHNDFITSMHAALTGANNASPTSPNSAPLTPADPNKPISPSSDGGATSPVLGGPTVPESPGQAFLFKLVPPRSGLSKGVNFTRPSVHYFSVPNREEGRKWMAALMKATIDRDETSKVITTYQQKTISLEQARARKERPPFLKEPSELRQTTQDTQDTAAGMQEGSLAGDTAVATEAGSAISGSQVGDGVSDAPSISTEVGGSDGNAKDPSSGLGIQGLLSSSENDFAGPTNASSDRMKISGPWS